ncbi:hypothetical protein AwDysgo_20420 [Bacteroidales bacterium]|nr:hypothetical protein AwDysgo_20420 [Bacteroidales bacterium]
MLADKHFIVEEERDESLFYKAAIANYRNSNNRLDLTIAPTMDCNYSCPYCFEKKEETYMSSEVIDSIVKYIAAQKEATDLHVTWFGGEPLLAIDQIREFYCKVNAVWTKGYTSNIITNGFLITPKVLEILKEVEVKSIQITLDGLKENHNKMKYTTTCADTFSKTIENIDLILATTSEIHVTIRVNLDKNNANDFVSLYHFIADRYKGVQNIGIAPAFILDRSGEDPASCKNIFFSRK